MSEIKCIIFADTPDRWKPFDEATQAKGWRVRLVSRPEELLSHCLQYEPDLVIIDDFPESKAARSVFYKLRAAEKAPFLILSDSSGDMRFSRLGALSFIQMIKRNPKPADLINTAVGLIESYRESRSRPTVPPIQAKKGLGVKPCKN